MMNRVPTELTIVESLGTTQENVNTQAFNSPEKLSRLNLESSPEGSNLKNLQIENGTTAPKRVYENQGSRSPAEAILEQSMIDESDEDGPRERQKPVYTTGSAGEDCVIAEGMSNNSNKIMSSQVFSKNSGKKFSMSSTDFNRIQNIAKVDMEPLPIYEGEIRGYEPTLE